MVGFGGDAVGCADIGDSDLPYVMALPQLQTLRLDETGLSPTAVQLLHAFGERHRVAVSAKRALKKLSYALQLAPNMISPAAAAATMSASVMSVLQASRPADAIAASISPRLRRNGNNGDSSNLFGL